MLRRLQTRGLAFALWLLLAGLAAAQAPAPSREQQIEARFLEGLSLLQAGRARAAIPIFQSILAEEPGLVRVRLELARAYFEAREWRRSRTEFLLALSGDVPDPVRDNVMIFIAEIDARRGFEWNLDLGLTRAGETREYDSDTILLDLGFGAVPFTVDRRGKGGTGLAFDLSAELRTALPRLSAGSRVATGFAGLFAFGTKARETDFDDYAVGARAGIRLTGVRSSFTLGASHATSFLGGAREEYEVTLDLAYEVRNATGTTVFGTLSGGELRNVLGTRSDATVLRGQAGVSRARGGRARGTLLVFGELIDADRPAEDSLELGLRASAILDTAWGLRLEPSAFVSHKEFRTPNPAFVEDPDEFSYGIALRIEKRDWLIGDGAFPFAEASYRRTESDISAFSYREITYQVGLSRQF